MKASSDDVDSWLAGLCASLAYLSAHSYFYNFDGVACAIAVDLSDFSHLLHGNHIAYGLVGWAFCGLWRLWGYSGPGIIALQVLDCLLGAAAVGVFHRLARDAGFPRSVSAGASAGLAASYAWWFWSLEAQVYMLGALFLVLAAREALSDRPRASRLGLWHGLAVLGHVEHAMLLPAALFLLKKDRLRYLAVLAGVVLAAYAAAAVLVIRPHSSEEWRVWLLGSAALTPERTFRWHGAYSLESLRAWAETTARIFTGLGAGALGHGLALCALAAAARGAVGGGRLARAAGLWLGAYAALIVSWEPSTIVYRVSDLVPLWLLIAAGAPRALLWGLVLALSLFNWRHSIAPAADPQRNAEYQEALWVGEKTPPDAWVAVSSVDHVYVPYFAHRKPLALSSSALVAQRLAGREPVFITSRALGTPEWTAALKGLILSPVARRPGLVLYWVAPGARSGPK